MTELAPRTRKVPFRRHHHGDTVNDPYEWLRERQNPAVLRHLRAENAYAERLLGHLGPLRETLFGEIRSRVQETDLSVPVRNGQWWYFSRTREGKQYPVHARAPIHSADDWRPPELSTGNTTGQSETAIVGPLPGEQVILDDNVEAAGHDFYSLGSFDVSPDGSLLAYAVDVVGDERYRLAVRDLNTGRDLADCIPNTFPGAVFSGDGRFLFYLTVDDAWRPDTVWRHRIGSSPATDEVVHREADERFWVSVSRSRSRQFVQIDIGSKLTSETRLVPADNPTGPFEVVWPRREGVEYSVEHAVRGEDSLLYILHNDKAVNFELVTVSVDDPLGPRSVLLPERRDTRWEEVAAFAGHTVLSYRRDGMARVGLLRSAVPGSAVPDTAVPDTAVQEIDVDEALCTVTLGANPDWQQPTVRLDHTSLITPATVYDYAVKDGSLRLLKQQPVRGGYDPTGYEQRRLWATATDGARIPISVVGRVGTLGGRRASEAVDGAVSAPGTEQPADLPGTLLYGYGAYEHSIDPAFSAARLSLLDRGIVFAIAHVRGGGELGRSWYEDGKLLAKKNTFTDFVAAADYLIQAGFTRADRLVAEGRSAGGLLMGAVANLAPDRFAGILAGVPFVDPLTSMLNPALPLTVTEWEEWGNPLEDAEVYAYLKSYSPYENVRAQHYPRILATTSLNDTRVLYVEPAKWVAALREQGATALLKTELNAGHGGASGRYDAWRERAWELAWILDVLGHTT